MNKLYLVWILVALVGASCANRKVAKTTVANVNTLDAVVEMMTGKFSSEQQSKRDSLFYDISLTMVPIWKGDANVKWLYVEQAVSANLKKPYRQRVYRLSLMPNEGIESRVYTLSNPESYIHAWENLDLFEQISPASLTIREGCGVYLEKDDNNCYAGATNEKDCKSTMRGASYATSIVSICAEEIVSWDQGWDAGEKQVWGAETEGYVFRRLSE